MGSTSEGAPPELGRRMERREATEPAPVRVVGERYWERSLMWRAGSGRVAIGFFGFCAAAAEAPSRAAEHTREMIEPPLIVAVSFAAPACTVFPAALFPHHLNTAHPYVVFLIKLTYHIPIL